jgi:hypothetical protein
MTLDNKNKACRDEHFERALDEIMTAHEPRSSDSHHSPDRTYGVATDETTSSHGPVARRIFSSRAISVFIRVIALLCVAGLLIAFAWIISRHGSQKTGPADISSSIRKYSHERY